MTRLLLLAAGALLAAVAGVRADELRVDPADGCADDGSAPAFCTLAAAIRAAERSPGRDVVHLAEGSVVTLREVDHLDEGANALPPIAGELVIEGHGARIERAAEAGTPELRLLRVTSEGDLTLRDLTLRNGATPRGFDGAAVWSTGRLTLERCVVEDNVSGDDGGGIRNDGTLRIADSVLRRNQARWFGGVGGAVQNAEQLGPAELVVERSSLLDNEASAVGGALWAEGTVRIVDSTLRGNRAGSRGGAVQSYGALEIVGSTITGNRAEVTAGGIHSFGTASLAGSIVAGNLAPVAADCGGRFATLGQNLLGTLDECELSGDAPGDRIGAEPGGEALRAIAELGGQIDRRAGDDGAERIMITTDGRWRGGDDGLRNLGGVPGLYKLRLGGRITDAGLVHLGRLEGLEALDLHLPEVTDEGVRHLRGLTGLERLNLTYTRVTDAGLEHLVEMKDLKWLGLAYTRVTAQGVERLRGRLPGTVIEGDFRSE